MERPVILFGRSLGSGIAALTARSAELDGIILMSPYRSIAAIARRRYPFAPVGWMLKQDIDATLALDALPERVLVLHARRDRVVPDRESRAFLQLLPVEPEVVEYIGPHNIALETPELWAAIEAFVGNRGDRIRPGWRQGRGRPCPAVQGPKPSCGVYTLRPLGIGEMFMRHDSSGYSYAPVFLLAVAICSLAVIGDTGSARAEGPDDAIAIEEIVVTARKREESLQDVPLSVSAFNESAIENAYGENIGEFSKFAPNVTLARQPYAGNALFAGMRGIVFGDLEKSFDPAVGVVIDGVPLVTNTGALIDTFDLESVEILRGPQGTLFGRNTIAGVVNARRTRPTGEFGLRTQFRYGAHNETDGKAVLNFPLGDTLAVKMAAFYDKGDGFQEQADFNLATGEVTGTGDDIPGEDTINFYTSILWEPTENFEALLTFELIDDDSTLATPINLTVPNLSRAQWGGITGAMFANFAAGVPPAAAVGGGIGSALVQGGNFCDIYGSVLARSTAGFRT